MSRFRPPVAPGKILPALALVALLALPVGSLVDRTLAPPLPPILARTIVAAHPLLPASPSGVIISGHVFARNPAGGTDPYLPGPMVYIAARPCPVTPGCTPLAAATATGSTAAWTFTVAPGDYFLWTGRYGNWGGASEPIDVTNTSNGPYPLEVYPYEPYGNRTFDLPGYNPLLAYAANCNAGLPCHSSSTIYGSQVPILSWTSDGVFYVNMSLDLVFYSFPNATVRDIGRWLPLYDNLMTYEGIENTEWITADGSYVYEIGCSHTCLTSTSVTVFGVNTTTGRNFTWDLFGINRSAFAQNGQIDMIGEDGNHSIAVATDDAGTVLAFNIWNRTQWVIAVLPFFEANNNYWVPGLNSYFDIEAQNDPYDWLLQIRLAGPYPGTTLEKVAVTTYAKSYLTGGVNGLAFNATAQQIYFTVQSHRANAITSAIDLSNGSLSSLVRLAGNELSLFGSWPNASAYPNVESSEHRPSFVSSGPSFAGYWNGWFDNTSSFVDPASGNWLETNVSFDHPQWNGSGINQQHQLSPAALEELFYNASYSIVPWSVDCRVNFSACPLLGGGGNPIGTIWWMWANGTPEFPFSSDAPIAQTVGPSVPQGVNATWDGTRLRLTWSPPASGNDPLVNYTLFWGTEPDGFNHTVSLAPGSTSFTLVPGRPQVTYFFRLEAWNLHWHGPFASASVRTSPAVGFLNLTIAPAWASVTVDGSAIALTNGAANLSLNDGSHSVLVSSPGYATDGASVQITTGNVTLFQATLAAIEPVLAGSVEPSDALVWANGVSVAVDANGTFQETVAPGTYALSAAALGYDSFGPLTVTLGDGQSRFVPIVLNRSTGSIRGTIDPAGALLTLDGEPAPAPNGLFDLTVPTGSHTLWAGSPGFVSAESPPIAVTANATAWYNLTLSAVPGLWVIHVSPSNASVTVDGTGYSASVAADGIVLSPGSHSLLASAPGYDPFSTNATVAPNQTTDWSLDLNRSIGWADVTVVPASATLSVDGMFVAANASGRYNLTLTVGSHTLRAATPTGASTSATVTIADRASRSVRLAIAGPGLLFSDPLLDALAGAGIGALGATLAAWVVLRRGGGTPPGRPNRRRAARITDRPMARRRGRP